MSVPVIRFNSFSEDWHLESISSVISNKSKKYDPIKAIEDLPCIELEHLSQQTGEILDTISAKDQKSIKNIFDENSVLFGKLRPYLRKFARPDFKGVCSSEIWVLKSKKLQPDFLFQYIQTDNFFELTQIQAGSKMPRADWESISKGEIYFPNSKEQTKIASFLSAVDEKISQLTQKHELLSQYKQGMMQKLFSQQIRFKADDGSEFGEWRNKKVIDLFVEIKDKVLNQDIETYSITAGKGFVSQAEKFGRDISGQQNSNYIVLKPQDFSYNKGNSKTYKYGCVYLNEFDYSIAVPNVFISFRAKNINEVNQKFYAKLFEYHYLDKHLRLLISSSARMDGLLNVSKDGFFEINVPYPCLEEQTKIANFLSAIDQKIEVEVQQIEQAKTWKKGLLQQMFV